MDELTPEQIKAMQDKLASLEAANATLAAEKEATNKVAEDAKAKAAELEQKAASLAAENATLKEVNDKLDPKPVQIDVNGKTYEFTCPSFTHKNEVHKATDVAAFIKSLEAEKPSELTKDQTSFLETIKHLADTAPGVLVEVE